MNRNEYRRAFIMLRSLLPGYGGHARLERRTLTGSMYFIITAPQGVEELQAALAGRRNGETFAVPIGRLSRDRRGQLALAWTFDPRDIQGRPLEAYSWVAVAATGGPCAVALVGNVEGSRDVDPAALSRAVCALFSQAETALETSPSGEDVSPEPMLEDSAFVAGQTRFEPEALPSADAGDEDRCDIRIYTSSRARRRRSEGRNVEAPTASQPAEPIAEGEFTSRPDDPAPEAEAARQARPAEGESVSSPADPEEPYEVELIQADRPVTAAQRLGLDITTPWPEAFEPLRRPFATQAPLDTPLGDGFVYISAPMPQGSGLPAGFVGLKAENGRITALRHAVPGRRAPEPPAGLESYRWMGAVGEDGYWVRDGAES